MHVHIEQSEPPVSSGVLDEVESRLSISLPEEYRQFLLTHNGGRPEPAMFRFKGQRGACTDSCVDWFLAVYDGEFDNFELYFENYKIEQVRLPLELVPIAHDPGGNLICIAVSGLHRGAVYFWDHEYEANNGEAPAYRNVHLIAESFSAFLGSLSESP